MNRSIPMTVVLAAGLALGAAGCSDSGGGPLHHPDLSTDRIVGAAVDSLLPVAAPGPAGSVAVLDHLDPAGVERAGLPERISRVVASWNTDRSADLLSDGIRDRIRGALAGRTVDFVGIDPAPLAPGDPQCEDGDTSAFVRMAVLPGLAVHGDVYLVVTQTGDGCGGVLWAAATVRWEPGGIVGGEWVVSQLIGDASGSS